MPSAAARRMHEDHIPSFMSVFVVVSEGMADGATNIQNQTQQPVGTASLLLTDPSHQPNDSTSTQTTESNDSSPTTTMSSADSVSLLDPSPSSSPESPVNKMPAPSFLPTPFSSLTTGMGPPPLPPPPQTIVNTLERPMTSPSPRRARNMKGLSIQPVSLNKAIDSEPPSPSFIKPKIPAMKRKPSQLSLKTNSSDLILRQPSALIEVPQSPGTAPPQILQRRALKHSTSSPHMLSALKSASFGPAGGMSFPTVLERNESGLSNYLRPTKSKCALGSFDATIAEEGSPIKAQVASRAALGFEPFHEQENEDQKTPGYPDGPICVYDPNVYLYLEPTAEEASKFDVVINVAREVRNPFKCGFSISQRDSDMDIPVPDTAIEGPGFAAGFAAHLEAQPAGTPADSKPTLESASEPEYIHVPWDHNTDIQTDLMQLCETMDNRTKQGKKVLVHCQQGASRSASLIIAYGMYQNPQLSVNDAYYAAQSRSKWISPNMRLMYCLQDFQKDVGMRRLAPGSALNARSGRSPTKHHRTTLSAGNMEMPPNEPLTAPLPKEENKLKSDGEQSGSKRPRGRSTANHGDRISPGPYSAPSTFSWVELEDENDTGKLGRFNFNRVAPSPVVEPATTSADVLLGSPPSPRLPSLEAPSFQPQRSQPAGLQPTTPKPMGPGPLRKQTAQGAFEPLQLGLPPASPGFGSFDDIFQKPPPSPGFGAHRFGKGGGLSFGTLNMPTLDCDKASEDPSHESHALHPPEPSNLASHPVHGPVPLPLRERRVAVSRTDSSDMALMSPRAETMTNNPLHNREKQMHNSGLPGFAGMQFVDVEPTPSEELFSPRQTMFPRHPFSPFGRPPQMDDPRSPPTKGETPIVRSIDDMI